MVFDEGLMRRARHGTKETEGGFILEVQPGSNSHGAMLLDIMGLFQVRPMLM